MDSFLKYHLYGGTLEFLGAITGAGTFDTVDNPHVLSNVVTGLTIYLTGNYVCRKAHQAEYHPTKEQRDLAANIEQKVTDLNKN